MVNQISRADGFKLGEVHELRGLEYAIAVRAREDVFEEEVKVTCHYAS